MTLNEKEKKAFNDLGESLDNDTFTIYDFKKFLSKLSDKNFIKFASISLEYLDKR